MNRRPFEEGWDAGLRGYSDPRVICPYEKQTAEWKEWHKFYTWGVQLLAASKPQKESFLARIIKELRK